jgi:GST-like protein
MLSLYYSLGPNPMKAILLLEELGVEYITVPVDVMKGEQHEPTFLALNPNAKLPVLVDGDMIVFDSNAILLYLADKFDRFAPKNDSKDRGVYLSWLMFIATGVGPFSGQSVHFKYYAPQGNDYSKKRYEFEARRHYSILNTHLNGKTWMLGEEYSVLDMALWGWARNLEFIIGAESRADFVEVFRVVDAIDARPAGQRAAAIKDRYTFKFEMDDEAKRSVFRHLEPAKD